MFKFIKRFLSDRKAAKRGEVRVSQATRGRIYKKKDETPEVAAKGTMKMTITGRVYRAATNTWEELPNG